MVQSRLLGKIEHRPAGPSLWIPCTKDDARNPRENNGAETHGAGFDRHIQRAIHQPPGAQLFRCRPDDDHFRMSGGILPRFPVVVGGSNDFIMMDNDRSNWYFTNGYRAGCLL